MPKPTATSGRGALSRFAHLAGLSKARADDAPATTDDVDQVEDKVDDTKKDVEELEEKVEELEDRVEDVEDEDEDEDTEDKTDPDEPPADKPEARKAYRAGVAKGRKAERARAGAIMSTKAAASNIVLATHLAFETGCTPKAALATLRAAQAGTPPASAAQKPAKAGLDARMGGKSRVELGNGQGAGKPDLNTADGVAANMLAVARRAGVIK